VVNEIGEARRSSPPILTAVSRLKRPFREATAAGASKVALSTRSVHKSQYRLQISPSRYSNVVLSSQYLQQMEVDPFPVVGRWKTYVLITASQHRTSSLPVLVAGSGKSILRFVNSQPSLPRLKTLISSAIIEEIMSLCNRGSASLGFFYFDFRDEDKKNHRNLLLSLLLQLSTQSDIYCDILSRLHSTHCDGIQAPSDDALTKCLNEMLSSPSQRPVYLVVDALDECPDNSGMPSSREQVLDLIKDLVDLHLPNLHVCVTSRPEIDIRAMLEPLTSLHVSLHAESGQKKDIIDYINSIVCSDAKMRKWREEDKRLVVKTLSEKADGM
jgi:NACHT domain